MYETTTHPSNSTVAGMFRKVFGSMAATIDSIKVRISLKSIEAMKPVVVEKLRKAYASSSYDTEAGSIPAVTRKLVDWPPLVLTFCFGGGIAFSFVSTQIRCQAPISFDFMSVLIALAFSLVFLSNSIAGKHPVTGGVLEFIGVLFAAAALFTALCIPLPLLFKCLVWTIFTGAVLGIAIVNVVSSA
ncbi:hypothetical protein QQ045_010482 [Rhodiola kirilowii]